MEYKNLLGRQIKLVITEDSDFLKVLDKLGNEVIDKAYYTECHQYDYGSIYVFNIADYLDMTYSERFFWSWVEGVRYNSRESALKAFKEKYPNAVEFTDDHKKRVCVSPK